MMYGLTTTKSDDSSPAPLQTALNMQAADLRTSALRAPFGAKLIAPATTVIATASSSASHGHAMITRFPGVVLNRGNDSSVQQQTTAINLTGGLPPTIHASVQQSNAHLVTGHLVSTHHGNTRAISTMHLINSVGAVAHSPGVQAVSTVSSIQIPATSVVRNNNSLSHSTSHVTSAPFVSTHHKVLSSSKPAAAPAALIRPSSTQLSVSVNTCIPTANLIPGLHQSKVFPVLRSTTPPVVGATGSASSTEIKAPVAAATSVQITIHQPRAVHVTAGIAFSAADARLRSPVALTAASPLTASQAPPTADLFSTAARPLHTVRAVGGATTPVIGLQPQHSPRLLSVPHSLIGAGAGAAGSVRPVNVAAAAALAAAAVGLQPGVTQTSKQAPPLTPTVTSVATAHSGAVVGAVQSATAFIGAAAAPHGARVVVPAQQVTVSPYVQPSSASLVAKHDSARGPNVVLVPGPGQPTFFPRNQKLVISQQPSLSIAQTVITTSTASKSGFTTVTTTICPPQKVLIPQIITATSSSLNQSMSLSSTTISKAIKTQLPTGTINLNQATISRPTKVLVSQVPASNQILNSSSTPVIRQVSPNISIHGSAASSITSIPISKITHAKQPPHSPASATSTQPGPSTSTQPTSDTKRPAANALGVRIAHNTLAPVNAVTHVAHVAPHRATVVKQFDGQSVTFPTGAAQMEHRITHDKLAVSVSNSQPNEHHLQFNAHTGSGYYQSNSSLSTQSANLTHYPNLIYQNVSTGLSQITPTIRTGEVRIPVTLSHSHHHQQSSHQSNVSSSPAHTGAGAQQQQTTPNPSASPRPTILRRRTNDNAGVVKRNLMNNSLMETTGDSAINYTHSPKISPPLSNPSPDNVSQSSTDTASSNESPNGSSLDRKIKEEPLFIQENGTAYNQDCNAGYEASPRKKPRKQFLQANNDIKEEIVDEVSDEEVDKSISAPKDEFKIKMEMVHAELIKENTDEYVDEDGIRWLTEKRRPNVSLLNYYNCNWRPKNNHFQRYTDVKQKEERRPTVNELSNQKGIMQKASGWKLYHVASQMEEMMDSEKYILEQLSSTQDDILPSPRHITAEHSIDDDLGMVHELSQGIIQRCRLLIDQLDESRSAMLKILDHKKRVMDIVSKHHSKRTVKKKERS